MLYSIHFLRFVASFAVLFWHTTDYYVQTFKVGAAGVDLFFIISGLVIGLSTSDGDSPRTFVARRFIRVMPMYWLSMLAYIGLKQWTYHEWPEREALVRSILLLPKSGVDWSPIYWPAWSVSYELFFYLVMFVALMLVRQRVTQACILFVTLVAVTRVPVPWDLDKIFQSDWGLEFVAGLLICEAIKSGARPARSVGLASLVLCIVVFGLNSGQNALPRILAWGVPSALAVVGAIAFEKVPFLRTRLCRLGGDISYTIYLFHITIIEFTREMARRYGIDANLHPLTFIVGQIALSLGAAVLINRFIERPMLDGLRRLLLPQREAMTMEAGAAAVKSHSA